MTIERRETSPIWAIRLLTASWIVLLAPLGLLYLTVPTSPDQALFDYIAWLKISGYPYYSGVAEQNWPGKMLMHEFGVRLFGVHFWTFRLIDFIVMQAIAVGGAWFLRRAGLALGAAAFLLLYPCLYVTAGYWMAGQRDIVAAGVLIVAGSLALGREDARAGLAAIAAAGALTAAAVLMRPTYLPFLAGLLALEVIRFPGETRPTSGLAQRLLATLGGFAAPVAALALGALAYGGLDDWWMQTIRFNLDAYPIQQSPWRLLDDARALLMGSWHWLSLLGTIGLALWLATKGVVRAQALLLGGAATACVSYVAQNKGFGYHLGGLLPALGLLAAVCLDRAAFLALNAASGLRRTAWMVGLSMVAALALAGAAKKLAVLTPNAMQLTEGRFMAIPRNGGGLTPEEAMGLAAMIREGSDPEAYFLQWGRSFEVGFLAERRSSIRFVSTPALTLLSDRFAESEAWIAEVRADLVRRRPSFVLIERSDLIGAAPPFAAPEAAGAALEAVVGVLNDGYGIVAEVGGTVLLRSER